MGAILMLHAYIQPISVRNLFLVLHLLRLAPQALRVVISNEMPINPRIKR